MEISIKDFIPKFIKLGKNIQSIVEFVILSPWANMLILSSKIGI